MAVKYLKSLKKDEFRDFIDSFDVVLSDCDGVLWTERQLIEGSPETVVKFRQLGKRFFYITNNNAKTREQLVDKCQSHGYNATMEDIVCSSHLAALYLKQKNFKKKVYIVGSDAIAQELKMVGINSCGVGPDIMTQDEVQMLSEYEVDPEVGAVVVGFDKHFSYPKLLKAATYVQDPSVHFIGTNPDVERPSPTSVKFPGAGCFIRAIEAVSVRKAVVLGKPEPFLSEVVRTKYGVEPHRTLMIGDNLNTDILLGQRCGFTTLLVMSGITKQHEVDSMKKNCLSTNNNCSSAEKCIVPDFYADQLSDVLDCLASNKR